MAYNGKNLGFWAVVAIGVGGMVGGGIFAVLGLAVQLAHGGTPVAFFVAGLVALITAYAYSRLSVAFPSQGGTVEFLNQAFGASTLTGGLNVLLWISYVIMVSLYAYAFGSYGASFLPEGWQWAGKHLFISGAILLFTLLNISGSTLVGEAEEWVVGFKVAILLLFIGVGIWSVNPANLAPGAWTPTGKLIAGGMIIFLAYEGFELIANTAGDVKEADRTLPRAYFSSVVFVIILYILVSLVTVGNLPVDKIVEAKDYALAVAAKPFLGQAGFTLIALAALLSTGSAINATLYGTARVSYIIAKEGELPDKLEDKIWNKPIEGLLITSGASLLIANLFDISSISMMGSAGFLVIFAAVNASCYKLHEKANSSRFLSALGVVASLAALGTLIWQRATTRPQELWVLLIMGVLAFGIEYVYQRISGRKLSAILSKS